MAAVVEAVEVEPVKRFERPLKTIEGLASMKLSVGVEMQKPLG